MACYHPLKALRGPINGMTGKPQMIILSRDDKRWNSPEAIELPCGKCVGCRLEYSRQWATRCMLEAQYHESSYFVTLTYNEDKVPITYYPDESTGEALPALTLCKRDFQLFMKRLRKRFPEQHIRFFAAGEYGDNTMRPHYHAILFGLHLDDLVPYQRTEQGHWYYKSESLQQVWSSRDAPNYQGSVTPLAYTPLGEVIIGEVTFKSCAYTARYMLKKLKAGDQNIYAKFGLEPPFSLMSRKPGIGAQYYKDHPEAYDFRFINLKTEEGGKKLTVPRYFDRLLDQDDPERLEAMKLDRMEYAKSHKQVKEASTSLRHEDYLEVEEAIKKSAAKTLLRRRC